MENTISRKHWLLKAAGWIDEDVRHYTRCGGEINTCDIIKGLLLSLFVVTCMITACFIFLVIPIFGISELGIGLYYAIKGFGYSFSDIGKIGVSFTIAYLLFAIAWAIVEISKWYMERRRQKRWDEYHRGEYRKPPEPAKIVLLFRAWRDKVCVKWAVVD